MTSPMDPQISLRNKLRRLTATTHHNGMMLAASILFATLGAAVFTLGSAGAEPAAPASAPPASGIVELTPEQLSAIRVGAVESYAFPVVVEATGSIGLDEDPQIVQAESVFLTAAASDALAGKELARAKALYADGEDTAGVSQRELEQATFDAETAHAQLTAARYALRALGESDAYMDALAAGDKPHRAAALHEWAVAYVAEGDSPSLRTGQSSSVRTVAYPDKVFPATVSKVYATVDPNTHRLAVRCEVDDPEHLLRTGMLADVSIEVQKARPSISVPADAVVREGDGALTAWVTSDHRHFTQRVVTTGLREDGRVQILSGLRAGEQVVTDGAIFLDNMLQAPPGDD